MMTAQGYKVTHYGNAGSEIDPSVEDYTVLTEEEFRVLGGAEPGAEQYGSKADVSTAIYMRFNEKLADALAERVEPGDIICLPFGRGHLSALRGKHSAKLAQAYWVETGIGYSEPFCDFRIYESAAWMHFQLGRQDSRVVHGRDYWFVIPNYYDPADWKFYAEQRDDYVLFAGRLNSDKGLAIVTEIAKHRPDVRFVVCGQGNPEQWLVHPNIHYHPPIHGPGMDELMGKARLLLAPTRYVEPFGGVAAEALLCGTPVAASAFGAFPEYITPGRNGWLCRTLKDWLRAVDEEIGTGTRMHIRNDAELRFGMAAVGHQYREAFEQIANLRDGGWFKL